MGTVANEVEPSATPVGNGEHVARGTIAGRYEIDLRPRLGGMAQVYRGKDLRTRRDVAVKTLRPEYRADPEIRARFRREARLMAFLGHPNVVRVFDFVEDQGTSWVVLEWIEGRTLREVLAERGPLPPAEVAPLLEQAGAALGHLHARGLVHLDVKPQNLLLSEDGRLKLIDFGLAQPPGSPQQAIAGLTFGTAPYLAPEQACGEAVGPATDVYALGCVVYELLTGRPPFQEGGPGAVKNDVVRAHLERAPEPPSTVRPDLELPRWVDDVLLWALAKEPDARYGTAEAFARLFRAGADGERIVSPGTTSPMALVEVPAAPRAGGLAPVAAPAAGPGASPRQDAGRAFRAGAWLARRSSNLRRWLWRGVVGLGAANVVLALLLFLTHGAVPGVYEPTVALRPGATARVVDGGLRVRAAPGFAGEELVTLAADDRVSITGEGVAADGRVWWPIAADRDGTAVAGYAAAEGLAPQVPEPSLERFRDAIGLD